LLVAACSDSPTEPPRAAAHVFVEGGGGIIGVGDSVRLVALVVDSGGRPLARRRIAWRSLAPAILSVDSIGRVRGEEGGVAAVEASTGDVADTVNFRVEVLPRAITVALPDTLAAHLNTIVYPIVRDGRGRPISWTTGTMSVTVSDTTVIARPTTPDGRNFYVTTIRAGRVTLRLAFGDVRSERTLTVVPSTTVAELR
jgi:hypothetical protein